MTISLMSFRRKEDSKLFTSLRVNFRNDNVEDLYREVRSENSSNFSIRFLSESLEMTNKSHPELISGSHKVEDEKLKQVQFDRELKKDSSTSSE